MANERKVEWDSMQIDDFKQSEKDEVLKNLDEDDDEEHLMAEEVRNAPTLMETPYGLIERDDSLNPFRQLKFYMMKTNFNIRAKEFIAANFHDGVEAVKIVSRYRMMIGFGDLFDVGKTKESLSKVLIEIDKYPNSLYKRQRKILIEKSSNLEEEKK